MRAEAVTALRALEAAEAKDRRAANAARRASLALRDARLAYAAARPLTDAEKSAMVAHVRAGGALCCAAGLDWLKARLPRPWAEAIGEWAYCALGCKRSRPDPEDVDKVLALDMGRFPR